MNGQFFSRPTSAHSHEATSTSAHTQLLTTRPQAGAQTGRGQDGVRLWVSPSAWRCAAQSAQPCQPHIVSGRAGLGWAGRADTRPPARPISRTAKPKLQLQVSHSTPTCMQVSPYHSHSLSLSLCLSVSLALFRARTRGRVNLLSGLICLVCRLKTALSSVDSRLAGYTPSKRL
ncbi:unnamed protein product [Protopolystoma xenopodis]|uniref:Uncharacterized protein n=1 Tax=Protopolystoma xenopodis TaxID=117903 RepID=A0A448XFF9_9PLAT|nr:unnamed protein product [Protopolystoma xenopodis]